MKFYLTYSSFGNKFTHVAGDISDPIEIILPDGYKECEGECLDRLIEHPDGYTTLATDVLTEHFKNGDVKPYIMDRDCKRVYLNYKMLK